MKKRVIFILLVLITTFAKAHQPGKPSDLEKLNLKPIESLVDDQKGKIDKETGALRVRRNEYFKSETNEGNETAWSYLQANQDIYGINTSLDNIRLVKSLKSPAGVYFYFRQYIHDIPVYATKFTVYVNNNGIVKYALNEFRNIDKYRNIANSPLINANRALEITYKYLNIRESYIRGQYL